MKNWGAIVESLADWRGPGKPRRFHYVLAWRFCTGLIGYAGTDSQTEDVIALAGRDFARTERKSYFGVIAGSGVVSATGVSALSCSPSVSPFSNFLARFSSFFFFLAISFCLFSNE